MGIIEFLNSSKLFSVEDTFFTVYSRSTEAYIPCEKCCFPDADDVFFGTNIHYVFFFVPKNKNQLVFQKINYF